MSGALDRPLPHNPEAERAVLGAIFHVPQCFWRVAPILNADHFHVSAHRAIYSAMCDLANRGDDIDIITVKDEAKRTGALDKAGGPGYIASLMDGLPDFSRIERYAEIVARHAKLRNLAIIANGVMTRALEAEEEPDTIAREAISDIADISTSAKNESRALYEVIDKSFAEHERMRAGNVPNGLVTKFAELDHHRAIRPGALIIIGSPSNHGKTTYAVNLAEAIAAHNQATVFFTLESTEEEAAMRYVSTVGGVVHSRVQNWATLAESDFPRLVHAQQIAHTRSIFLQRRLRTVEAIYAECQRLKATVGLKAALVDYIQLLKLEHGPRDREERMAVIAQTLLEMAIDLNVAVIATSQLNKERMERSSGRILQSDLKYAAAIGESARVVLLFQRPYADDKTGDVPPCTVKFQIEKNNQGLTNDYDWHFDPPTQTFREGDCEANDCRRLQQKKPATANLFA